MTVPHSTLILSWGKDFHLLSLEKTGKSQRRLQLGSGSLSYILHVCVGLCVHPLNLEELHMCWPTQSVPTGHSVLSSLFRVAGSRAALRSPCWHHPKGHHGGGDPLQVLSCQPQLPALPW